MQPKGVVLDAGAFIALERRNRAMVALSSVLANERTPLVTSAGVVVQVVSYTPLRVHETKANLVCLLLLANKNKNILFSFT